MNTKKIARWVGLQASIFLFSFSGVFLKLASQQTWLSFYNLLFYALALMVLGVYALLWQQILRWFPLSIAYVNKGLGQVWTLLWSLLLFGEALGWKTLLGAGIIIAGVLLLVKTDDE